MATLIPITIKLNTDDANKSLTTFESKVQSVFATQKINVPIGFDSTTLKFNLEETETIARQAAHRIQDNFKSVETLNFNQPLKQLGEMKTLVLSTDNSRITEMRTLVKGVGTEAQKAADAFSADKSQVTELLTVVRAVGTEAKKTAEGGVRDIGKKVEESVADFDKLKTVGAALEDFGGKIKGIGQSLTSGLTDPLTELAEKIVSSGITYEHSLNSFQDSTKATADEMVQASAVAVQLSTDVSLPATSAAQAAEAMDGLGKAGFTAAQSMAAAKDIIKLAAAGQIDQAKAAEIAGGAINSFSLKAEDSSRVVDLFAGASKASGVEITNLAATFSQSSTNFANAKIPIEDFTTAVTIMAKAGMTGGDAGKSLNAFLSSIQTPSKEGAAEVKKLGLEIFDAGGKMKSLPDIIGLFNTSLSSLTDQGKADAIKKIFGSDASQAAQALFKNGVAGFEKIKEAVTETGAASELAAAKTQGVGGAFELLKARAETVGTVIYAAVKDKAEEALIKLADLVGNVADYLGNLSKNNPQLIQIGVVFLGIVAAIGPVVAVLGSVIAFLGPIIGGLGTVAGALAEAGSTTALLTAGFTAVSTFVTATLIPALVTIAPVVLAVVAVVAGLAAVAVGVYEAWESNFGNIQGVVATFETQISDAFNGLMGIIQPAVDAVSSYAIEGFGQIQEWWATNGQAISQAAEKAFGVLLDIVRNYLDAIKEFWTNHGTQITEIISAAWSIVKTLISTAISQIGNTIMLITNVINGDWSGAWKNLKNIVQNSVDASWAILKKLVTIVADIIEDIAKSIANVAGKFLSASIDLAQNIIDGLVKGIGDGTGIVTNAIWSLGTSMIQSLRLSVNSHSPSRDAMEIGQAVTEGFALGIAMNASDAAKTAEIMAKGALKPLKDTYDEARSKGGTSAQTQKQAAQDANEKAKAAKDAQQQAEQTFKKISDSFNKILSAGVKGGFKNMLKAALGEIKSFSDSLLTNFTKSLSDALAHAIFGNGVGGKSGGGFDIGSIFKSVLGGSSGTTGSGAGIGGIINSGNTGGVIGTGAGSVGGTSAGGNTSDSVWDNLKNLFSTKDGGIFAPRTNILKGKGSSGSKSAVAGYIAGAGTIASFIGGLIGDNKLGRTLSYAGQGAQVGSLFGPWGAAIGAGVGALIGLFTGGTRKQDEQARTAAINDAMSQLQTIKAQLDARPPTIEPSAATSGASQIQSAYYTAMNQLKDSKTRNIAIQDGHLRVDPLVSQVAASAAAAQAYNYNRAQTSKDLVGEFADGVYMDSAFRNQYNDFKRVNGMMPGAYTGKDYIRALIGDGEVVANPAQLERMRRAAGFDVVAYAGLPNYTTRSEASVPKFASGVSFAAPSVSSVSNNSEPQFNFNPTIEINFNGNRVTDAEIESIAVNGVKKYYGRDGRQSPKSR